MKNNEVILEGRIIDVFYRENYVAVKLSVHRPGVPSQGDKQIRNYPRVIWRGEEAAAINEKYHTGDRVKIKGYIDTNSRKAVDGKVRRVQYIYGENIEPAVSDVEETFGVKPAITKFASDTNTVKLKGELVNKFASNSSNSFCRGVIKVISNNQVYYPTVLFFRKAAEFVTNSVPNGSTVFITGSVQTYRKEDESGQYQYSEDIVCDEIAVQ